MLPPPPTGTAVMPPPLRRRALSNSFFCIRFEIRLSETPNFVFEYKPHHVGNDHHTTLSSTVRLGSG